LVTSGKYEQRERVSQFLPNIPRQGSDRLCNSLARTEVGFSTDLRTPFYREASREAIAADLERRIGISEFEDLANIDEHERSKLGPLSIMLPFNQRIGDVEKYGTQKFYADQESFHLALANVASLLPKNGLRPANFDTALELLPKDTSLGLPWVSRDRYYVPSYFQRAVELNDPKDIYPAILYWRGQAAGPNATKQRVVWGMDHAETIFGATVLYPLLNSLRTMPGYSAWLGDVYVDEAITNLINTAQGRTIISMDYSSFDSSLSAPLLQGVDWVLGQWFDPEGVRRIALLAQIANTVPIVVPWELMLTKRNGGMPSGSVLTNMRDTIANRIALEYIGLRSNSTLMRFEILGDDGVSVFANDIDSKAVERFAAELGLECNPDKQFLSTDAVHYLQRWHSKRYVKDGLYRGVRSPYRALAGMTGYERFRENWNKYLDTSRWIMQIENCKNHPQFEAIVRFLKDGDSVLDSGMDPATVFRKAGGADVIRSVLNIASFPFNVQNPEGVESFQTTNVLRSLN